jgi:hypothetical protein
MMDHGHVVFVLIVIKLNYLNVKCVMLEKEPQQGNTTKEKDFIEKKIFFFFIKEDLG